MQALWEWRAGDRGRSREEVERTIVKMLRRRGQELGSHHWDAAAQGGYQGRTWVLRVAVTLREESLALRWHLVLGTGLRRLWDRAAAWPPLMRARRIWKKRARSASGAPRRLPRTPMPDAPCGHPPASCTAGPHRTRPTSPFLQLANRSLVSMAREDGPPAERCRGDVCAGPDVNTHRPAPRGSASQCPTAAPQRRLASGGPARPEPRFRVQNASHQGPTH